MSKTLHILIVDDHPLLIEAYIQAFNRIESKNEDVTVSIKTAANCEDANHYIMESSKVKNFDLVLFDLKLPPSNDSKILSGEDLAHKVKELFPNTKIIISTTFNDSFRISSILKNVDPDGFFIKNDIKTKDLIDGIETAIESPPYYSKTVLKVIRRHVANNFTVDKIDRQLLYQLSNGAKMKDLPKVLPLSIAGIERRKRILKEAFNLDDQDDKALIRAAKEKGFI